MLELFTNPGYLAAGAALISAPIIIHLINRMRFKRLRWAAMEFLLKSQKRNRRRLLIEQLLLLALRCLLVLLATMLVARFVGLSFDRFSAKAALHVVLLDDTLSMNDQFKENERSRTSFEVAKEDVILNQIVRNVGQSTTQDRLLILPLSKAVQSTEYQPKAYTRLNESKTLQQLESDLKDVRPTKMHVSVRDGIERVQTIVDQNLKDNRVTLHVVSDFRQRDWGMPAAEDLHKQLLKLANNGVKIRLVDTAHPYRVEGQGGVPIAHDNVAIVDLRPSTRVAGVNMPVNFTVTLANFGPQDVPVHVAVHEAIKGEELKQVDLKLPSGQQGDLGPGIVMVPAGSTDTTASFELRFPPDVAPGQKNFGQIFARLESKQRGKLEKDGLDADNIRFTAVEVRNKVPVLVIDGEGDNGRAEGKDSWFIDKAIMSVPGSSYEIVFADTLGGVKALEKVDLRQYPTIFMLNVRDLEPKSKQLRNLEAYVREGGGVVFFLGPRVASDFYNDQLYKKGAGLFPMPLSKSYYPQPGEQELKPEFTGFEQVLLRDEGYSLDEFPIFGPILIDEPKMRQSFVDLLQKRYFKVPRSEWKPVPGKVVELATLPNEANVTDYQQAALGIVRSPVLAKLFENPQLEKYKRGLDRHRRTIEEAVSPTSELKARDLAEFLQKMLDDKGDKKDETNAPNLTEFWAYPDPKVRSLHLAVTRLIAETKYGDPFIVASQFGGGRVVAVTTTAGTGWNNWGGGSFFAAIMYQPFIWELQNYLSAPSQENVLDVGDPVTLTVDREQYTKKNQLLKMVRYHQEAEANKSLKSVKETELFGVETGEQLVYALPRAHEPGLYISKLVGDNDVKPLAEWGHVYNVDAASESRLERVSSDELNKHLLRATEKEGMIRFETPQAPADELINRQSDLSESPWFYLFFLAILVAEQALAVHLSFHLKGGEETSAAVAQATRTT